jgi:hypothetical protein
MNKTVLKYSVGAISLLLACVAAYFSITGLSKLFAGSGTAILIMASTLELGKLVTVSYLNRFWKVTKLSLKIYLSSAVCILMLITSLGIYGFLTAGYQITKNKFELSNTSVTYFENQKLTVDNKSNSIQKNIDNLNERLQNLYTLRNNTENRINKSFDSNKFSVSNSQSKTAKQFDSDIKLLQLKIETLESDRLMLMDSSANIQVSITKAKLSNESANELGPLMYVAKVTNIDIDIIVSVLILLFIIVFDPLAIALLLVFNNLSAEKHDNEFVYIKDGYDDKNKEDIIPDININTKPLNDTDVIRDISKPNIEPDPFDTTIFAELEKKLEEPTSIYQPPAPRLYGDVR